MGKNNLSNCLLFYAYFFLGKEKISFSVPTGNFGDVYAGYVAKKIGTNIDKLIVATNLNDILHRTITTGRYLKDKVYKTHSPSMDIQVSSNFERLLYHIYKQPKIVKKQMEELKSNGFYQIEDASLNILKEDLITEIKLIKNFFIIHSHRY